MNEWCAYGMEVPLRVPGCDVPEVVQCYVPYLSAMQLRRVSTKRAPPTTTAAARAAASALIRFGCGHDSDMDARSMSSMSDSTTCSSEHGTASIDSDCDEVRSTPRWRPPTGSKILFEYNETRPPHLREPLTECVEMLAKEQCPELMTLRSCDLDPHSWYGKGGGVEALCVYRETHGCVLHANLTIHHTSRFSIAWYPLYRLQATGRTIRDLNACFLTYHRLGTVVHTPTITPPPSLKTLSPAASSALARREAAVLQEGLGTSAAVLAPFAMVPYKLGGRTWEDTYRSKKLQLQLLRAADEVSAHSGLHHGDFAFFVSTLRGRRC